MTKVDQPWTVPMNECKACGDTKREGVCPTCSTTGELDERMDKLAAGLWVLSHGRWGSYEAYQSDPGCDGDPHDGGTCGDPSHATDEDRAAVAAMRSVADTSPDDELPF